METIKLNYIQKNSIDIIIDNDKNFSWLSKFNSEKFKRFFIIIDENVEKIWGKQLIKNLNNHGKKLFILSVKPTENSKSLDYYPKFVDFLERNQANRFDLVIGIGGGIILDLVSFGVSTYMRGLPFMAIPTTIIGQTDAITAGKTCLNTKNIKNLLGTFYYPYLVYNNIEILKTNTPYYERQGLSEMYKYGLLGSKELLKKLMIYNKNKNDSLLVEIIKHTVKVREKIRNIDPLASNLGHTFGHAFEKLSGHTLLHGDAITVGTVFALNFAKDEGLISKDKIENIITDMKILGLNLYVDDNLDIDELIKLMLKDKKSSVDEINLVLIEDIEKPYKKGNFPFYKVKPDKIKNFLNKFLKEYQFKIKNCSDFIKMELHYD